MPFTTTSRSNNCFDCLFRLNWHCTTNRWQEIRDIHKDHRFIYQVGGGLALVIIGVLIGAALFANDPGYQTNLYTEILSIGVTIFVLNLLAERREEKRRIKDLQERLVWEVGGEANGTSKRAINELRGRAWLERDEQGLLKGSNLAYANLRDAGLGAADLEYAQLQYANLELADLTYANLREANFWQTNLNQAAMYGVDLYKANLGYADLRGVYLNKANLQGANLKKVIMNGHTILPDDTKWSPDTDLARFTDPNHPDFWRWDDPY